MFVLRTYLEVLRRQNSVEFCEHAAASMIYKFQRWGEQFHQPTNQPMWLTMGGDLSEAQVDVPCSVWSFLRVTVLLALLTVPEL